MKNLKRINFFVYFPKFTQVYMYKDVGIIPKLLKLKKGYNSYIITYNRIPKKQNELNFILMSKKSKHSILIRIINTIKIIKENRKKIDILNLYHLTIESFIIGFLCRIISPKSVIYLKLDFNHQNLLTKKLKIKIGLWIANLLFDIITVETKATFKEMIKICPKIKNKLFYLPNGAIVNEFIDFNKKKNLILHVGRIGTYQKASEIALESFIKANNNEWKLIFIGPARKDFIKKIKKYEKKYKNIKYLGFIDRKQLEKYYKISKLLFMPSRYEGFSIAVLEGLSYGCVLIGTNIQSFKEITLNGKLGYLCDIDDINCFSKKLRIIFKNEKDLKEKSIKIQSFIKTNYNWEKIISKLDKIFKAYTNKSNL